MKKNIKTAKKYWQRTYYAVLNIESNQVDIFFQLSAMADFIGVHVNTVRNHLKDIVWDKGKYKIYFNTQIHKSNTGGNQKGY